MREQLASHAHRTRLFSFSGRLKKPGFWHPSMAQPASEMIAVNRATNDPFYRYKMPSLQATYEGTRTLLSNLDAVAKALAREPAHIAKFMALALGCQSGSDARGFYLGGAHDAQRLQQLLYDFIDRFVLCPACANPETQFIVTPDASARATSAEAAGTLARLCNSCGATSPQPSHKINALIQRALPSLTNDDRRYAKSNHSSISELIHAVTDNAEQIRLLIAQEQLSPATVFSDYVKPSEIKQLRLALAGWSAAEILAAVEEMLERHGREDKIELALKALNKYGVATAEIEEYFSLPRNGKKRSALLKRGAQSFLETCE